MTARVDVDEDRVVLQGIECREADVVAFFGDAAPETRVELAGRAVAIGLAGLRTMGVAGHVELVEREFAKLSHQFDRALATAEGQLLERVHSTFDPDHAESVSARLAASVADAHGAAGKVITETRSQLERLIQDSFNSDLATSCVYRIAKLVTDTRAELDRAFDPTFKGSHLSHLVDSYFGEGDAVEAQIAAQVGPVKDELMGALQGLRELVVGQAMAARPPGVALLIGWARAEPSLITRLATVRGTSDMASPVLEQLVAVQVMAHLDEILVERGVLLRRRYDTLAQALADHLPDWRWSPPAGGLVIWAELPQPMSTSLAIDTRRHGVQLTPGPRFGAAHLLERFVRLPFTEAPDRLERAIMILARLTPKAVSLTEEDQAVHYVA